MRCRHVFVRSPLVLFPACPRRRSFAPSGGPGSPTETLPNCFERQHSPDRPLWPILLGDLLVNYRDYLFGCVCSRPCTSHLFLSSFLAAIPSFQLRASAPALLQQCLTPRSELRPLTTLSSLSTWSEHVHWCAQSLFRGYSFTSAIGLSMTTTRSPGRS